MFRDGALPMLNLSVHVGTEDRVNTSLVARVPAKPIQNVCIHPHSHGLLGAWHHYPGLGPESVIRRLNIRVLAKAGSDLRRCHGTNSLPVGAGFSRFRPRRCFASNCVAHAVPVSMTISDAVLCYRGPDK